LKFILEHQININNLNILKNIEIKNKITDILQKSLRNENKGIISLNNLFNTEALFNNLNDLNNNNSATNVNIINDNLCHPLDYMINLFNERLLNKNNILYIYLLLLNMKENNGNINHIIGIEEYNLIFENFDSTLYLLLKYFNNDVQVKNICNLLLNSYSPSLNFCHYIILKCLSDDYEIKDEKYFGKLFVSYLQFVTIEKLLISDIYSFIVFTISPQVKKVIAKSSILIKYKYTLLKQNYRKDQKLLVLGQKIFENIEQFGTISKNNFFRNYLKDTFYNNNNNNNIYNTINENYTNENVSDTMNNNNEVNNFINNDNKNNINYINDNSNINNNNGINIGGDYFSSFTALFRGNNNESNNDNNNMGKEQKNKKEEENKKAGAKLGQQEDTNDVPETEYDPVLKRWKLNGIIYDDQEEVVQKKRLEKPMVPPPKSQKYANAKKNNDRIEDDKTNVENNIFDDETNNQTNNNNNNNNNNSNVFSSANNRINNPFGSSQIRNPPKPQQTNQKQRMNNLTNRYAVGYRK
jgi:hypothetical protein